MAAERDPSRPSAEAAFSPELLRGVLVAGLVLAKKSPNHSSSST
jgi:hypothetical protein